MNAFTPNVVLTPYLICNKLFAPLSRGQFPRPFVGWPPAWWGPINHGLRGLRTRIALRYHNDGPLIISIIIMTWKKLRDNYIERLQMCYSHQPWMSIMKFIQSWIMWIIGSDDIGRLYQKNKESCYILNCLIYFFNYLSNLYFIFYDKPQPYYEFRIAKEKLVYGVFLICNILHFIFQM